MSATPVTKEVLIRFGYEKDLEVFKPAVREFLFIVDSEKLFIGASSGPRRITFFEDVDNIVTEKLTNFRFPAGTTTQLDAVLKPSQLGFNTEKGKIEFVSPVNNEKQIYLNESDLPFFEAVTIKVASDNIDSDDDDSVTLSGFNRPFNMIFVNGVLSTTHDDDPHKHVYSKSSKTLKIYNMSEDDIIAYY